MVSPERSAGDSMIGELDGGIMGKVSPTPAGAYEPPSLLVLGSVHALTLAQNKKLGDSDGFLFMGEPITNAS
jgi:hypothetical protein